MKKLFLSIFGLVLFYNLIFAQSAPANEEKIQWMSMDEAVKQSKKNPKKIFVDVYTDWCGWCKKMDMASFAHPTIIKNMNKYFYAVKLNAEGADPINFNDKTFIRQPNNRTHDFAVNILDGRLSYPTTVYYDENFVKINVLPGFLTPEKMEMVLKYFGENNHKKIRWEDYQESFVSEIPSPVSK